MPKAKGIIKESNENKTANKRKRVTRNSAKETSTQQEDEMSNSNQETISDVQETLSENQKDDIDNEKEEIDLKGSKSEENNNSEETDTANVEETNEQQVHEKDSPLQDSAEEHKKKIKLTTNELESEIKEIDDKQKVDEKKSDSENKPDEGEKQNEETNQEEKIEKTQIEKESNSGDKNDNVDQKAQTDLENESNEKSENLAEEKKSEGAEDITKKDDEIENENENVVLGELEEDYENTTQKQEDSRGETSQQQQYSSFQHLQQQYSSTQQQQITPQQLHEMQMQQQAQQQQAMMQQNAQQQQYQSYQQYPPQTGSNEDSNMLEMFEKSLVQVSAGEYYADIEVPSELSNDPSLNLVGMLIGPSGYTQKQMEQSTGCSITVRGMGSTRNMPPIDGHRQMFVHVKGSNPQRVKAGFVLIYELLFDKSKRDRLRQQQLAMRASRASSLVQTTTNPMYYMQNFSTSGGMPGSYSGGYNASAMRNRSPFQNALSQTELGGNQLLESIVIPSTKKPFLAGKMEEICYYTGVKADVKDLTGNASLAELTLQGSRDQVVSARKKLQNIMADDPNETNAPSSDHTFVPNTVVGLLIGKSGETIKKFMADTGCRMKVIPEFLTNPEDTERKVLLYGNPNQCANAKFMINDLVMKHKTTSYNTVGNNLSRYEIVSVPCGCIGILIGKGGETIRAMSQRTNCRVQVVQYDENQLFPGGIIVNKDLRHVSMKGDENSIRKAKIEIQSIINEHAHRHGYEPPRMDYENGDPYLGLSPEQYEKYVEQMKTYCNMDRKQVHEYYRSVMSQIAREPAEYAEQVRQHLLRAQQATVSAAYYQQPSGGMQQQQFAGVYGGQSSGYGAQAAGYGAQQHAGAQMQGYGAQPVYGNQQQQQQLQQQQQYGQQGGSYQSYGQKDGKTEQYNPYEK